MSGKEGLGDVVPTGHRLLPLAVVTLVMATAAGFGLLLDSPLRTLLTHLP